MKLRNAAWMFALTLGVATWSTDLNRPVQAQGSEGLVMVVNSSNTTGSMSLADARKLLLGETSSWHSGAKVVIVLKPAGSPDRAAVLKKVCGMTEAAYTRYEMQASFTGQTAASVHDAPSDAAIKSMVKANPGAVGFLPKAQVDASVKAVLTLE